MDRMLREEQEQAYQVSLQADRDREQQERQEREVEEALKREEEERERLEAQKEIEKKELFSKKLKSLPAEPTSGDILSLAFRLPHGKRLQRKFDTSNSVEVLYDFIDTHPEFPAEQVDFTYTLISNYPKKEFPRSSLSLKESGVPNNTVLEMKFD